MKQLVRVSFVACFLLITEHASGGIIHSSTRTLVFDWSRAQIPLEFEAAFCLRDDGLEEANLVLGSFLDEALNHSLYTQHSCDGMMAKGLSLFALEDEARLLGGSDLLFTLLVLEERQRYDRIPDLIPYNSFFPWDSVHFSHFGDESSHAGDRAAYGHPIFEPSNLGSDSPLMSPYLR